MLLSSHSLGLTYSIPDHLFSSLFHTVFDYAVYEICYCEQHFRCFRNNIVTSGTNKCICLLPPPKKNLHSFDMKRPGSSRIVLYMSVPWLAQYVLPIGYITQFK